MNNLSRKKFNDESGMALMWAIMLMALAMFIIVPLLLFTQTTLIVNNKVTESVKAQYAAEAGVEEALWRLSTPGILPQPGTTTITLPRINGYLVSYNVATPPGKSYSILTSWAYANPGSENMSVVRAKMNSGQFLFSYAVAARGPTAHPHDLWVGKVNIYSTPTYNMADLYSDGSMQFTGNPRKVSGTLYAANGISPSPDCDSAYDNPPWGGTCSWRSLPWSQVNMWDITPSPDGLPDSGGGITDSGNPMTVATGASDVYIGPRHVNGNLTITGGGAGRLILNGPVYVDGYIQKTGTQDIVDLSGGVTMLSAQGNVSLKYWNTKLTSSAQLPIIMSINGDISCTGASKWICALLYAPNSPNGLTSDNFQLFGACNISGIKNSGMTIEYPSDIKTTRNWPSVYGGTGSGNISAYSIQ